MRLRVILVVSMILAATALVAQTFRGTVMGTVTDASGAVISGATVKVRNANTGLERVTQTSADGSYAVPELQVGTYTITVSQSGFQTSVTNSVNVDVAEQRRVDVSLKPGQVSEQVEVSGENLPQVETTTNDLGGVLTELVQSLLSTHRGEQDLPGRIGCRTLKDTPTHPSKSSVPVTGRESYPHADTRRKNPPSL